MQVPLQIVFHQIEKSAPLEALIREKAAWLEKFSSRITSMRILIEPLTQRHQQGNLFHVRIDLTLPGHEIAVSHRQEDRQERENAYIAVRDAFNVARRQLEDYVKSHYRKSRLRTRAVAIA